MALKMESRLSLNGCIGSQNNNGWGDGDWDAEPTRRPLSRNIRANPRWDLRWGITGDPWRSTKGSMVCGVSFQSIEDQKLRRISTVPV